MRLSLNNNWASIPRGLVETYLNGGSLYGGNTVLNIEVYKDIEGFPYQVSTLGNVRNQEGLVLQTYSINSGYQALKLVSNDGIRHSFLVHRLVGMVFLGLDSGLVINHKDGDKQNNSLSNLEVVTQAENLKHARDTGLWDYNKPTTGKLLEARGTSGIVSKYHGVCWDKSRSKWRAYVVWDKVKYTQKRFDCEEDAAKHRDSVVKSNNLPLPLNFN